MSHDVTSGGFRSDFDFKIRFSSTTVDLLDTRYYYTWYYFFLQHPPPSNDLTFYNLTFIVRVVLSEVTVIMTMSLLRAVTCDVPRQDHNKYICGSVNAVNRSHTYSISTFLLSPSPASSITFANL